MKWIIYFTIVSFIIVVVILLKAMKDAREFEERVEGALNNFADDEIFSEFEDDEHSPLNLEIDKELKVLSLRQKLNNIEAERNETKIDSFDFDNREDGR